MRLNRRFLIILGIVLIILTLSVKVFLDAVYRVPIMMYHFIDYTSDKGDKRVVSPEAFEAQMKYLHDKSYNVVPLEKAVWYIEHREKPPSKTVAITMDDGYKDNYVYAYPVLKKYHIPATIFVIVNLVGKEKIYMNWDEVKEMSGSGIIDIESHTKTHPWLTSLSDKDLKDELTLSKKILEEKLRKKIDFLCYPMGVYDERVKLAVKAAGYKAAFATRPKRLFPTYDLYEIKRVRMSPNVHNLLAFRIKITGYYAFLRTMQTDSTDIPKALWRKKGS